MEPIKSKVTRETLIVLESSLSDYKADAISYLISRGLLQKGEQLDQLEEKWAKRIIGMRREFWKHCCPEQAEKLRMEQELEARTVLLESRIRKLSHIRPDEYDDLSSDSAPRPQQFKFVAEFLTGDNSPYFSSEQASSKRGLVLFGKSRTGKTAACWEAIRRYWMDEPENEVEFVKSVSFVRKAKSRHLSSESKSDFEEMFDRLLMADLLVLDDLGTEKLSDSAEEVLFELIDTRTERWRFTIITTNYTIEELAAGFLPKDREKIAGRIKQFFLPICFDKP